MIRNREKKKKKKGMLATKTNKAVAHVVHLFNTIAFWEKVYVLLGRSSNRLIRKNYFTKHKIKPTQQLWVCAVAVDEAKRSVRLPVKMSMEEFETGVLKCVPSRVRVEAMRNLSCLLFELIQCNPWGSQIPSGYFMLAPFLTFWNETLILDLEHFLTADVLELNKLVPEQTHVRLKDFLETSQLQLSPTDVHSLFKTKMVSPLPSMASIFRDSLKCEQHRKLDCPLCDQVLVKCKYCGSSNVDVHNQNPKSYDEDQSARFVCRNSSCKKNQNLL